MRRYHPRSWSESARYLCDRQVGFIKMGYATIDSVKSFFGVSYRAPIIRVRAAKRFSRLVKSGKVKQGILKDGVAEYINESKKRRWEDANL